LTKSLISLVLIGAATGEQIKWENLATCDLRVEALLA
jgi:hypothetical protein